MARGSMGLSPLMVERVYDTLSAWQMAGRTILIVEQNAMMAFGLSNRGDVLCHGRGITDGAAKDRLEDEAVRLASLDG